MSNGKESATCRHEARFETGVGGGRGHGPMLKHAKALLAVAQAWSVGSIRTLPRACLEIGEYIVGTEVSIVKNLPGHAGSQRPTSRRVWTVHITVVCANCERVS
jgi:hypothetical protein